MNKNIKLCVLIVASFIIGGAFTFTLFKFAPVGVTQTITKNGQVITEKNSLASSVEKVKDAVVMIQSYKDEELISTGTGFIYKIDDNSAYILTNNHVTSGGDDIKVVLSTDEVLTAKQMGADEYLDLSVLKIDKSKVKTFVSLKGSSSTKEGDTVFTIGTPLGSDYRGSVTSGVLSGKDRLVTVSVNSMSSSGDWVMKVLQMDAAVNPGNSGGPLFNVNGDVIGIISMKLVKEEIEGMGFAISSEIVMNHLDDLEKGKEIEWPVMGVSMANASDQAAMYRYSDEKDGSEVQNGVIIASVEDDSGAAKGGLKKGDIIVKINGEEIKNAAYLRYELYKYSPGDTIDITYIRDKKEHNTKVKLQKAD